MRPRAGIGCTSNGTTLTLKYGTNGLFIIDLSGGQVGIRAGLDSDQIII